MACASLRLDDTLCSGSMECQQSVEAQQVSRKLQVNSYIHQEYALLCYQLLFILMGFSLHDQECVLQQRMKIENLLKHKANCSIQDKVKASQHVTFGIKNKLYTYNLFLFQQQDGNTALHLATIRKDVNTVRLLLNYCTQCINIANEVTRACLICVISFIRNVILVYTEGEYCTAHCL